jgi:hypothetical protein
MLIQELVGALGALLVQTAFGFGSAESRAIRFSLFLRLLSFGALLESFQVDDIPHGGLHHAIGWHVTGSRKRSRLRLKRFPVIWNNPVRARKVL